MNLVAQPLRELGEGLGVQELHMRGPLHDSGWMREYAEHLLGKAVPHARGTHIPSGYIGMIGRLDASPLRMVGMPM